MAEWRIEKYHPEDEEVWNAFVAGSRNGTFLFDRRYMDYHSDRFEDCSLMAYKNGKLRGLLPANICDAGILHSHQGLTYGGWVTPVNHFDANDMLELWEEWRRWSGEVGITEIDYKPLPWIYSRIPAQEDLYALFRAGASVSECNLSSTIDLGNPRDFNTLQRRHLRQARKEGAEVEELSEMEEFYHLLENCLAERHGARPVHTLAELQLLRSRFPENIRIYGCRTGGELQAGVCLYCDTRVVHCQYIATTSAGRGSGALTFLFDYLIEKYKGSEVRYFDFGTSNENHSLVLNSGLLGQKAALGGSGVAYPRWRILWR